MKKVLFYLPLVSVCLWLTGCRQPQQNWLLVSFQKDVPITYRLISERSVRIDLTSGSSGKKSKPQTMSEKLEMVITYTSTEVDPFGLTAISAVCNSARVTRSSLTGRKNESDAMESLAGQHFTFQLSPTGEIADDTDLNRIIRQIGEKAFAQTNDRAGRVKNPDMISDFIAMQWHLWDSTSTITEPLQGMAPGKSWQVDQWVPWPIPIPNVPVRTTTYTLDSFTTDDSGQTIAVIKSTYALSETAPKQKFPQSYDGRFQMRGLMGFLRNYQFLSMEGAGEQVFNVNEGLIESDKQHYTMTVNAAFMLPLGDSLPVLTVDQTVSIERIKTP